MARRPSDSFLPSGAVDSHRNEQIGNFYAAFQPQRHTLDRIPSPSYPGGRASLKPYMTQRVLSQTSTTHFLHRIASPSRTPSDTQNGPPISPPVTRSASTDESSAVLIEDWRVYTNSLREQAQGERAHMAADRARMEECMNEERALWEKERDLLKARIAQLESQLAEAQRSNNLHRPSAELSLSHVSSNGPDIYSPVQERVVSPITGSEIPPPEMIPQESGRNPDGSPFYAPAPQNPSRTFDTSQTDELRVDSMPVPRETPFRVTSKELTQSDFGPQSPAAEAQSTEGSVMGESIDISQIQPELDGVLIKATAVSPTFVAKVLSPNSSLSPSKTSPNIIPPPRPRVDGGEGSGEPERKKSTLEIIAAPENRRLTMHAGHTPNHSVTNFDFVESGNATPKQIQLSSLGQAAITETQHLDGVIDEIIENDPELKGPLGLKNDPEKDDQFLAALTSKLEEVQENAQLSPKSTIPSDEALLKDALHILGRHRREEAAEDFEETDDSKTGDMPRLKMKPSTNFGRPFGSL